MQEYPAGMNGKLSKDVNCHCDNKNNNNTEEVNKV